MKPSPKYLGGRKIQDIPISSRRTCKKTGVCRLGLPVVFSFWLPWTAAITTVEHWQINLTKDNGNSSSLGVPTLSGWCPLCFSHLFLPIIQSEKALLREHVPPLDSSTVQSPGRELYSLYLCAISDSSWSIWKYYYPSVYTRSPALHKWLHVSWNQPLAAVTRHFLLFRYL